MDGRSPASSRKDGVKPSKIVDKPLINWCSISQPSTVCCLWTCVMVIMIIWYMLITAKC